MRLYHLCTTRHYADLIGSYQPEVFIFLGRDYIYLPGTIHYADRFVAADEFFRYCTPDGACSQNYMVD